MRAPTVALLLALAGLGDPAARSAPCPYTVDGKVTGPDGQPLEQAYVAVDSTPGATGVSTDVAGNYRLRITCAQARPRTPLVFRLIGYNIVRRSIALGDSSTIRLDVSFTNAQPVATGISVVVLPAAEPAPGRPVRYAEFTATTSRPATIGGPFDHASYASIRRFLATDEIPPTNSFGLEGLFQYPALEWPARAGNAPVALLVDEIPAPWARGRTLVRASLLARPAARVGRPRNVVLIIDASGMNWGELPRIREPIARMLEALDDRDRVSIIGFNGPHGALLTSARGSERARIRAALDSLEDGHAGDERNLLTVAATAANTSANRGLEHRLLVITNGDVGGSELGSDDAVGDASRLRERGIRVDVLHLDDEPAFPKWASFTRAGGGALLDGSKDGALRESLGTVFGVDFRTRATQPVIELAFDPRRVARWRCLNDVGGRVRTNAGNAPEHLFAGGSVTALCETEPVTSAGEGTRTRVRAMYRDANGTVQALEADAAPDSSLRNETRLLADAAAFGLLLRNPVGAGALTLDSIAASVLGDRGGYVADLRHLARLAKRIRR